jgi:hypothetical protein
MFKTSLKYFPLYFFQLYAWKCDVPLPQSNTYCVNLIMVYDIDMPWMLMGKLHELQDCNSIVTMLDNSFSIIMQLHYNYTHDVVLTSLIIIHQLKYDMWHYEKNWT